MEVPWTIQAHRKDAVFPKQEFATKREAVAAMELDRQPKTQVSKLNFREYTYQRKEA